MRQLAMLAPGKRRDNPMMRYRVGQMLVFWVAAAALAPLPADAGCDEAPNNQEMTVCLGKELQAADARLNAAYKKAIASLADDAAAKANLVKSERAWVAYKEAQCVGVVGERWAGGTGQGGAIAACLTGLTKSRILELEEASR